MARRIMDVRDGGDVKDGGGDCDVNNNLDIDRKNVHANRSNNDANVVGDRGGSGDGCNGN